MPWYVPQTKYRGCSFLERSQEGDQIPNKTSAKQITNTNHLFFGKILRYGSLPPDLHSTLRRNLLRRALDASSIEMGLWSFGTYGVIVLNVFEPSHPTRFCLTYSTYTYLRVQHCEYPHLTPILAPACLVQHTPLSCRYVQS